MAVHLNSLLVTALEFDRHRTSLPAEHWLVFGLGLYLLLRRRPSALGRVASVIAGAALAARALSGRDGAFAFLQRPEQRDAEGDFIDVARPWPYDEPVRIESPDH